MFEQSRVSELRVSICGGFSCQFGLKRKSESKNQNGRWVGWVLGRVVAVLGGWVRWFGGSVLGRVLGVGWLGGWVCCFLVFFKKKMFSFEFWVLRVFRSFSFLVFSFHFYHK